MYKLSYHKGLHLLILLKNSLTVYDTYSCCPSDPMMTFAFYNT